jgi:hypothetical protein
MVRSPGWGLPFHPCPQARAWAGKLERATQTPQEGLPVRATVPYCAKAR